MKCIFIGLPKTGTVSFTKMLKQIGMNVTHANINVTKKIQENHKNNKLLFSGIKFDIFTQPDCCNYEYICYPQIEYIDDIIEQYPDAKYILNTRDIDKWYDSMRRTEYRCGLIKQMECHRAIYPPLEKYFIENQDMEYILKNWFSEHNNNIIEKFQGKDNFLIFDIENDNIQKLRDFLEIPDLKPCWANKNTLVLPGKNLE